MEQRKIIPRKQRKLSQVLHRGKPEVSFEGQHHALWCCPQITVRLYIVTRATLTKLTNRITGK